MGSREEKRNGESKRNHGAEQYKKESDRERKMGRQGRGKMVESNLLKNIDTREVRI